MGHLVTLKVFSLDKDDLVLINLDYDIEGYDISRRVGCIQREYPYEHCLENALFKIFDIIKDLDSCILCSCSYGDCVYENKEIKDNFYQSLLYLDNKVAQFMKSSL